MNNRSSLSSAFKKNFSNFTSVSNAAQSDASQSTDNKEKCLVVPMYPEKGSVERKHFTDRLARQFNLVDNEEYRDDMSIEEKINYNNHILFQTTLIHSVVRKMALITSLVLGAALVLILLALAL